MSGFQESESQVETRDSTCPDPASVKLLIYHEKETSLPTEWKESKFTEKDCLDQCKQNYAVDIGENSLLAHSDKICNNDIKEPIPVKEFEPALKLKTPKNKSAKEQQGWKRFLGILLTIVAALQFSLSALVIKILGYHPFNLGVWRFMVMVFFPLPFIIHKTVKGENVFAEVWPFRSTTMFLILQAVLGANSLIFVFFGFKYLNIADSIVIGTSAPVFVTLFAFIFLGEKCGLFPVLTALLALIGVAIISKPPLFTGAETLNEETLIGVASSFTSMILLTICYIVIRYLRKVNHAVVNLGFSLWGLLQSIILANLTGVLEVPKDFREVGLIIVTAFLAFSAQTCITLALKYEQAGPVALVRTTEVLFAFTWQAIVLGVYPDFLSVLGSVVTISGVVLTALRKIVMSLPDGDKNKKRFRFLLL